MKNSHLTPIFCLQLILFSACTESPEFYLSDLEIEEVNINPTSNITAVISAYKQSDLDIYTFDKDDKTLISCYVISSDEAGNFYKTLVVQDLEENPQNGLEIKLDKRSYYTKYNFGRKLYIKLAGLSITEINGKFVLGYQIQGVLGNIPLSLLDKFIVRSLETANIVPQVIDLEDFSSEMINRYVQLNVVQFLKTDLGKTFSSEAYDKYNGERQIEQCGSLARTYLFTSTYSNFKSYLLPTETFGLRAVLSSDSFSGSVNLVLNNSEDLILTNDQRCDPILFQCADISLAGGRSVIYYENFEKVKNTLDIEKMDWRNINVNFGNEKFRKRSRNENTFVQISAYDSNEYVMDVWLISPEIDLTVQNGVSVSFDTRSTFEKGSALTAWFSSDYSGDFHESNWHQLNANISIGSRDGSNDIFLNSGAIQIACVKEKIHLAFRYLGSDPGVSTTYDLDNVLILGDKN